MTYCARCGAALQAGAPFCASCGSSAAQPAQSSLVQVTSAPAAQAHRQDTGTAELLLLIGAALAALLPLFGAMALLFFGALFAAFIPVVGAIPGAFFAAIALVLAVAGILMGFGGFHARTMVQRGRLGDGGMLGMGVGVVVLVTGNLIAALPLLLGGFMAWSAR